MTTARCLSSMRRKQVLDEPANGSRSNTTMPSQTSLRSQNRLGNGFPAAAVITTEKIGESVASKGLWNLSSHQCDPMAAAAVNAVIDIVKEENLLERAHENGEYFMARLRERSMHCPMLANVRGQGLMIGFDLLGGYSRQATDAVNTFMFECRRRGVHLTYGYGGTNFRIIPPLVITREEIDFAVQVIEESLQKLATGAVALKDVMPQNPYTKRLLQKQSWRRVMNSAWRSSPAHWVEKSRELIWERFRTE